MAAELITGLSALKTAFDLAKGLKDISDASNRNIAVIELQEKILATQSAQATLVERVSELEKEVAALKTWEAEKQNYDLTEIGTGTFAYVIKPNMRGTKPAHCICTQCYESGQKSILQMQGNTFGSVRLRCPRCKTDFFASEDHPDYPLKREHAKVPGG